MEVLETKEEAEARVSREQEERETTQKIAHALKEAQDKVNARHAAEAEAEDKKAATAMEADVGAHVEQSQVLKTISDNSPQAQVQALDRKSRVVTVTQKEKDTFLDSVISGERYTETRELLNGRLRVTFRSRSALESSAIDAYIRREVVARRVQSEQAYADLMRFCVLMAGVKSVNDEVFPTLTEAGETPDGMFYSETKEGLNPPKWLWFLDRWRGKAESLISILIEAYFDFEAKYWLMINNASVENFWNPGDSTGS